MTDTLDPTAQVFRQTQPDSLDAAQHTGSDTRRPSADEIAAEAYRIYLGHGTDGLDLDDWLEAERRLRARYR